MDEKPRKRFLFVGGIPVFDYMISVDLAELARVTGNNVFVVGPRLLLPVGTVFELEVPGSPLWYLNPMANVEVQSLHDELYYAMELGGKLPEQFEFRLCTDKRTAFEQLNARYPALVREEADLKIVKPSGPVQIRLGGNNKNLIEEITTLYASPELAASTQGISFEHHFFFDAENPNFRMVEDRYAELGVSLGDRESLHVPGLIPRIGYVLTVTGEDGKAMDRIILANRTNEEIIPLAQLNRRYFDLQYRVRRDDDYVETHLVVNSITNHEEIRLVARLLQTAHATGVFTYLCPTMTLLKGMDRLIDTKYYTVEKERFFQYRKDFLFTAILPYVRCMILNRDELSAVDNMALKKGIDATATSISHQMNSGRRGDIQEGGKVVVTGGSKGARYTERLRPERAAAFWQKAKLGREKPVRFAERRIVCGDDYLTTLTSTLGAGDVFTGIFIGLSALCWDGGHALRAATLGAQHFIQNRTKPTIRDMIAMDEAHIRLGTETELQDVVSHHVDASGDPTRYGTIADTVITVSTTQIQHPFSEVLALALEFSSHA